MEGAIVIQGFTECVRGLYTYRAHPNYRSRGEWYDWAYIRFEIESPDDSDSSDSDATLHTGLFPAKILCFYKHPSEEGELKALIQCTDRKDENWNDIIAEQWNMEYGIPYEYTTRLNVKRTAADPIIRSIDVDCIEKPLLVAQCLSGTYESIVFTSKTEKDVARVLVMKSWETDWPFCFTI
jgi:hypothetical protein